MRQRLVFLSIPGLRRQDLSQLTALNRISNSPSVSTLQHSFPAVTWPAQATMLCGCQPDEHGVVANGFYWRDEQRVEMWTAWNRVIERPQIWDRLKALDPSIVTAAWFPMLAKGCNADVVCMPAPIHKPDGSEELWCHTKPQEFYGDLIQALGHFPLKHFWGPLAGIQSSRWIAESAVLAHKRFAPHFWYIYLPHLDYAAQKFGPDSPQAKVAVDELNGVLETLVTGLQNPGVPPAAWLVASEYVISPVDHVSFPNRVLREAGWLEVHETDGTEQLDFARSRAWALVDHQFSHVFVRDRDPATIRAVADCLRQADGIAEVWDAAEQAAHGMAHSRSGDLIALSRAGSWQAYYWWLDDSKAPPFARTVDIHRKPGYDPVELFFDMKTRSIPLDATLVKGSHGLVPPGEQAAGVVWSAGPVNTPQQLADHELFRLVMSCFGLAD